MSNIFRGKMTLIDDVFLNLWTPKREVREMSKQSHLRGRFYKWHGKRAETPLKPERKDIYRNYWWLWRKFRLKKSLWVICNILGLFVDLLAADGKYSLLNKKHLLQYFQMQLSKKRKVLSQVFLIFSKFRFNFEHFQKKDDPHSWYIFKLTDLERRC